MRLIAVLALAALSFVATGAGASEPREVTVYAAASLTNALQELAQGFKAERGVKVKFSFAASSLLARQIEAGAEADVFVSADSEWMDYLAGLNLIQPATRKNILSNKLVLIAAKDNLVALKIAPGFPLAKALGDGRLAVADPETVPAGRYARAALTLLAVWASVAERLVRAENVRIALTYVARGVVLLADGRVAAAAALGDLTQRLDLPPEAEALGSGTILRGTIERHDDTHGLTLVATPAGTFKLPRQTRDVGVRVAIRVAARDVALALARPPMISVQNMFDAVVERIAPKGLHVVRIALKTGDAHLLAEVTAEAASRLELAPGRPAVALVKSVALAR